MVQAVRKIEEELERKFRFKEMGDIMACLKAIEGREPLERL